MNADYENHPATDSDRDLREARRLEAFERVLDRMARISKDKRGGQN